MNKSLKSLIRKSILATIDAVLAVVMLWVSLMLKYDYLVEVEPMIRKPEIIGLIMLLSLAIFYFVGFYQHIWRYASINQYLVLLAGTLLQGVLVAAVLSWRQIAYGGSVFIIYWLLLFMSVTGFRIAYRMIMNNPYVDMRRGNHHNSRSTVHHNEHDTNGKISKDADVDASVDPIRVMIVGVGYAGSQIIRELQEHPNNRQVVVAIDDNPEKHHYKVRGITVVGGRDMIKSAVRHYSVDEIILAIPSASNHEQREILDICSQTGCELRQVPLMSDLIGGRVSVSDIKHVEITDLLGREQILLDNKEISGKLKGKTIMVTGGGGSIGSEICRQVATFEPGMLVVFDIYENNAYDLQQQLLSKYKDLNLKVLIGSVRDRSRLETVFSTCKPDIVFHAAAHKHVPLMEDSPSEAVKNNVIGTYNTALAAARNGAERFVLISTDKAVNPTNVMGSTKRLAEMVMQHMAVMFPRSTFAAVRFGNVLGSNGSVIPLFKRQIREEGVVTVTHPDITRYFMTIPEASRLVIQAGALAHGGEIFVLDMGEPVKIVDLARDLIKLSGLEPDVDIPIVFTGLRPGEKMYEELYLDREGMDQTKHDKIFVLKPVKDQLAINAEIDHLQAIIGWTHADFDRLLNRLKFQSDVSATAYLSEEADDE
ncbi:MAG: nucleoside-diphosphate sugar epimerase/dehydratase [Eubacteriales bacterium]|nr:nucleoside-diphosphate sugar epimerase/dehydratase [Eubacteriales bacterium]